MTSRKKHYRVYVVGVMFALISAVLWVRLIHVQYFMRDHYREVARDQMVTSQKIEPVRGGIFDRHGRPLALSVRCYSVSVTPREVSNKRLVESVVSRRLGLSKWTVRQKLKSKKNFVWIKRQCSLSEETRDELAGLSGIEVHGEAGRIYPYGSVAAKLVGFVGVDNSGMAGVEAAYERELRGTPGSERVLRNGEYQRDRYYRFVEKKPQNGKHVFLTIDAVVQELAEVELERGVRESGARSGALIVMEADTGEILSLAEYPYPQSRDGSNREDSLWTLRSISHVYEPGSTFKLVTSAALLDKYSVAPSDTFDAEGGRGKIGQFTITDPHPHGRISFEDAFAYSSNIVMYKAAGLIPAADFYDYVRLFGFGEQTGIGLSGESAGSVSKVEDWSLRTQGTMAFGQEVAVTPVQMISAFGVVANDGVLVVPRIIKGVADGETGDVDKFKTAKIRRVISKSTAKTLQHFCRRVVEDGTGESAAVSFMAVSGKTGTAQKASPRGGYLPGKYVSSYIGYAPHEDPKIVCLVLLDEPRYTARFGGVSSAPVFARVCSAIANATPLFNDVLTAREIRATAASDGAYRAPNFLRMERAAALEKARKLGSNVLCQGDEGRVVSQEPGPGVSMNADDVVRLYVSSDDGPVKKRATPDLRGLPVREAKLVLAKSGFKCALVGSGVVTSQKPSPGQRTGYRTVKLYCGVNSPASHGGAR